MGAGRNSHFGWVQETTWGTVVTPPTKFAEVLSENYRGLRTRTPRPVIRDLDAREANLYDEKFGVLGPVAIELTYEGLLRLFEHAFSSSPTAVAFDAGARNEFTFSLSNNEPMAGKGLSLYLWKDIAASYGLQGSGNKVRGVKFSYDPKRNAQAEFDFVGKDFAMVAETAPTFPSSARLVAGHQTVIQIDTVARLVDTVEIVIDQAVDDDKRVLGSKNVDEPKRGGSLRAVTGTIVMDAVGADMDKFNAGTLFRLDVLSTGPVLGTGNLKMNHTLLKCLVVEDPVQINGPGITKSSVKFRALKPTAGSMYDVLISTSETVIA